jgi:hypothetical protein
VAKGCVEPLTLNQTKVASPKVAKGCVEPLRLNQTKVASCLPLPEVAKRLSP